jgi:subtilisin family serine protease
VDAARGPATQSACSAARQHPAGYRLCSHQGRAGKGCVVLFAAGNGNESVDLDGYASYDKVLAVAACNDRGRRSVYSDKGAAVF